MSRTDFDGQMRRLAGLKFPPSTMETHYAVLGNLALDVLKEAVTLAQREVDEFPSPNALLQFAFRVKDRVSPLPELEQDSPLPSPFTIPLPNGRVLPIKREWHYYCDDCSDSGWTSMWCSGLNPDVDSEAGFKPWMLRSKCQREKDHRAHEFVVECQCVHSNPAILKRKEAQARQAAVRTSGKAER